MANPGQKQSMNILFLTKSNGDEYVRVRMMNMEERWRPEL